MLKRVSVFIFTTSMIGCLQVFEEPLLLFSQVTPFQGGPNREAYLMTTHLYQSAFRELRLGYGAAISYALFALILVFALITSRLVRGRRQNDA